MPEDPLEDRGIQAIGLEGTHHLAAPDHVAELHTGQDRRRGRRAGGDMVVANPPTPAAVASAPAPMAT